MRILRLRSSSIQLNSASSRQVTKQLSAQTCRSRGVLITVRDPIRTRPLFGTRPLLKTCPSGPQPLFEPRLLYGHIRYIPSAPITSLQGIYDVVTLHVHIMCQDTQALHLKCFLCQTNKLMCCHFKPNPVPATSMQISHQSHIYICSLCIIRTSTETTDTFHMLFPH